MVTYNMGDISDFVRKRKYEEALKRAGIRSGSTTRESAVERPRSKHADLLDACDWFLWKRRIEGLVMA